LYYHYFCVKLEFCLLYTLRFSSFIKKQMFKYFSSDCLLNQSFVIEKYLLCLYEYDSFSLNTIHASRKLKEFKLFPLSVDTQIPPPPLPSVPDFLHSSWSPFYYFLGLSDTMVGAELFKPLFPFPFYGHFISEFHITTHGFLSLSSRLHDYIYKTQYIAPLRIKVIFTHFSWGFVLWISRSI